MINFLLLALLFLLVGMISGLRHLLYGFSFFSIIYIAFKLYGRYLQTNLHITHAIDEDRIFLYATTSYRIELENRGWLPVFWIKLTGSFPTGLGVDWEPRVLGLRPREKKELACRVRGEKRGYYPLGPLDWEAGDFLGATQEGGRIGELDPLVVFPRLVHLREILPASRLPFGSLRWKEPIYKDPYRVSGLRDYQSGDSFRRMHWKASAKLGRLQVKKYESTVALECALLLNMYAGDYGAGEMYSGSERGITAAASIFSYLNRMRHLFSFFTNGSDPQQEGSGPVFFTKGTGDKHLRRILELLARIDLTRDTDFWSLLREAHRRLSWGSTLIVITPRDHEQLVEFLRSCAAEGYSVLVLVSGDPVRHKEYLHRPLTAPLAVRRLQGVNDLYELGSTQAEGWGARS